MYNTLKLNSQTLSSQKNLMAADFIKNIYYFDNESQFSKLYKSFLKIEIDDHLDYLATLPAQNLAYILAKTSEMEEKLPTIDENDLEEETSQKMIDFCFYLIPYKKFINRILDRENLFS